MSVVGEPQRSLDALLPREIAAKAEDIGAAGP
jgi:hypothetical protein